jgi:hypothetical protein
MMNQRIQELAEQCTITEFSDCSGGFEIFDKEKFAQLIVAECCNFNYDFLESYREACEVNSKIREHFGVEQ